MFPNFFNTAAVNTDESKIEELLTRGVEEVIHYDFIKKKLLSGKQLRIKLGIDPTSPNLHLGRAVPLLKLRDFQKLGHQVVFVIGDGTGVVGDTSDKESERPMLTKKDVQENMSTYFEQAGAILDMNKVEKRRNSEWLHKLTYEEIGDHADQFSVADFIARDNIKKRLDAGKRVSLREMLYPLMQGYDSVALKADVELGGTDQRFNLLAGRALQERFGQERQDVIMSSLIEGTDGRKMSSSWGNTINLTESPADMYAKVMRINDDIIPTYFTNLTRLPMAEVNEIIKGLSAKTVNVRDTKMRLAHAIVSLFHNEKEAVTAEEVFISTVQKGDAPENVQTVSIKQGDVLVDVLLEASMVASKADFKRLVEAGAVTNKTTNKKITNTVAVATTGVYKIGKHRFLKIKA
ncbi:tyrosine--tRNA ligase [bacterium]|nr:tyrosine--tRNA ligase [Parcubacteria group bacterium]MBF05322.1 tyrosine--tRNA ligase [bacterium]|tara:strand:- start:2059 stop:3276 length:1218 start_codon:yes stop_codon:yes gene_type:complete